MNGFTVSGSRLKACEPGNNLEIWTLNPVPLLFMRPYSRNERIGGLIKQEMAELLRKQISDPSLAQATITAVKVSPDLRNAKIYFATAGTEGASQAALEGFKRARGFIKRELAQRLGLRYMPDIHFYFDDSIDRGARIDRLIKMVKENDKTNH
jgi:ribosome-binding factor A